MSDLVKMWMSISEEAADRANARLGRSPFPPSSMTLKTLLEDVVAAQYALIRAMNHGMLPSEEDE